MKGAPDALKDFMKDKAVWRFEKFRAEVIRRCVTRMWPDGDRSKAPYFPQVKGTNMFCRAAARAARISLEAVGMTARVDTGQRTRTGGRVLEVGTVLLMMPTLWKAAGVRNRLRMIRPDGRTVTRLVRIMSVHRLSERRAG